ncbi:MAG: hypothetical protein RJA25_1731 [Bacteroidota bacterium]|jgi:hypothetical protein
MKIEEIVFDIEDKNLFLIDDLSLKADAIRYSILPKLEIISNEIISRIIELYKIDFYLDYSFLKAPHFRLSKTQRKEPTKIDYTFSSISITGQRKKDKWHGLDRGDGQTPQISPSHLSIDLDTDGLSVNFLFNHPKNFTNETYIKFFDFFIKNTEILNGLSNKSNLKYLFSYADTFTLKNDLEIKLSDNDFDVIFKGTNIEYPIDYAKINDAIFSFLIFFPVLNACTQIALNKSIEIEKDINSLGRNLRDLIDKYYLIDYLKEETKPEVLMTDIVYKAESKIKVQAGIRWQVFRRDNWRCVACGRSAEDNVILHVDHIIPRSKGGKDELENYQTLCETCNIGKSNKDNTDLRKRI